MSTVACFVVRDHSGQALAYIFSRMMVVARIIGIVAMMVVAMMIAVVRMMVVVMMIAVPRCGWDRAAGRDCANNT
jgi:ABC-type maltose transport system permease subunit